MHAADRFRFRAFALSGFAIELAQSVDAQLLLIDDRAGDTTAKACGLKTVGTIGMLVRAAQSGLLDLGIAFSRLRETNFRCRPDLLEALLVQHKARQKP